MPQALLRAVCPGHRLAATLLISRSSQQDRHCQPAAACQRVVWQLAMLVAVLSKSTAVRSTFCWSFKSGCLASWLPRSSAMDRLEDPLSHAKCCLKQHPLSTRQSVQPPRQRSHPLLLWNLRPVQLRSNKSASNQQWIPVPSVTSQATSCRPPAPTCGAP
jgi:hypothetical protein